MPSPYQQEPIEESDLGAEDKPVPGKEAVQKEESGGVPQGELEKSPVQAEKEAVKEVSGAEKDATYNKILSKVKSPVQTPASDDDVKSDAEDASKKTDAESQVQHLVDVAMNKGVVHAVKVAKHLEDNYILDMFHDKMLSDELHDALVKKGVIKEL